MPCLSNNFPFYFYVDCKARPLVYIIEWGGGVSYLKVQLQNRWYKKKQLTYNITISQYAHLQTSRYIFCSKSGNPLASTLHPLCKGIHSFAKNQFASVFTQMRFLIKGRKGENHVSNSYNLKVKKRNSSGGQTKHSGN